MRLFYLFYFVFIISVSTWAQEVIDLETIHKIKQEGLRNSGIEHLAFQLTDAVGPRLTNSPGHIKAADWAVEQLKEWGIQNAAREEWGEFGKGWSVDKCYVAMTQPYYMPFICVPKAWTISTDGLLSDKVVLLDISSEEDIEAYRGKLSGNTRLWGVQS